MAALVIVLISVFVITEVHFINAIPVPKLSVKLLCELLCEHCNGVSDMESGHCNCEVPEAHFKDNYACLERVQISAAEVNLKLTHLKNTRPQRSVSDLLGRIKSEAPDDTQINYSEGFNKISDKPFTPVTPNPTYMDTSEYQIPELRELLVKRSINLSPVPEHEEQSTENELVKKRPINYFQDSSPRKAWYSKKSIIPMASSVFSGSKLRTPKLTVLHPKRKKRSYTEPEVVYEKDDGTPLRRKKKKANSNENYAVRVNVNVEIPGLKWNQGSKEKSMNPKLEENDDLQSEVSLSLVPDKSSILPSDASSRKPNTGGQKGDKTKSLASSGPTDESSAPSTPVSNKFRNNAEENIANTGPRVPNKITGLLDESNSLFPETKPEPLCPLKLPTLPTLPLLIPLPKFRAANEKQLLQRNEKLNDLKSRLEKLLARDQPRIPFQNLLQGNDLLKGPKSSILLAENTPLAKLGILNSLPDCSPLTKGTVNDIKLRGQAEGITLLEKIKNDQLKLRQKLLGGLAQSRAKTGNQFENENSVLPLKLYPLFPVESKARESSVDCDDYENNYVNALAKPSKDKSQLKSSKTENDDEKIRIDLPTILPVTVIPTDDTIVSTTLSNEPTENTKVTNTVKEIKDNMTTISQSSEPPTLKNKLDMSSTQEVTEVRTTDSIPAHTDHLPRDSNDNADPDLQQQQLLETTSEKFPSITSDPEAAVVTNPVPISILESHSTQSTESSPSSNDNNMEATSKHPHFVNHHQNPTYLSPVFIQPANGNGIRLSPEDTYRAMFDPASLRNDMQRINYPPLYVRNDYPYPEQVPVLNSPMVYLPYPALPFDQPGRLMNNFNGFPDHLNPSPPNEQNSMLMRAFVPAESFANNPENVPPSNVFVLKPLHAPNGNVPYEEMIEHIRNGNAVIEIHPINLKDVGNPRV